MKNNCDEKSFSARRALWLRRAAVIACICIFAAVFCGCEKADEDTVNNLLDVSDRVEVESTYGDSKSPDTSENSEIEGATSAHTSADTDIPLNENTAAPHEHAWSVWIVDTEATCKSDGSMHIECTVCKEVLKTEVIAMAHTNVVTLSASAQTCTDTGLTEGSKCMDCGEVLIEQTVIPTHTRVKIRDVKATCSSAGSVGGVKCSACNTILEPPTPVPAAHTSLSTTVELKAGLFCGDSGYYTETVSCKGCGEQVSRESRELPEKHSMKNNACTVCKLPQSTTEGMFFTLNPDGKSYTAGVYDDKAPANIVVGVYNGLSVTELGGIWSSRVRTVTIADCVKKMNAIYGENLTSVTIGNGIKEIPLCAFEYCSSLTTVSIGNGVEKIGLYAFNGCTSLYYAYITDAYDWTCNGRLIYGRWIGKEGGMESYFADYLKEYVGEWNRKPK